MELQEGERTGMRAGRASALLLVAALLAGVMQAASKDAQQTGASGTSVSPSAPNQAASPLIGSVPPFQIFPGPALGGAGFSYGTGGVGLRNRGAGGIEISGVTAPVAAAYIYWAVLTNGPAPAAAGKIQVQQVFPAVSAATTLVGAVIGVGASPCWAGTNTNTVYRAQIPLAVATGNGLYNVTVPRAGAGTRNGSDPYLVIVPPLWEGASIVIVGSGPGTVSIFDGGLAGNMFIPNVAFNYNLLLPAATSGKQVLLDNIGADGQHVPAQSRVATVPAMTDEMSTVNGFPMAGPGSAYYDSDWNGSSGLPVPELWDDTGHDITLGAPAGTLNLSVTIFNGGAVPADCLVTVANVVQQN
jgi:hypothetical protein